MILNYTEIEEKWQKKWAESNLNCAEINKKSKFMIIFAYPGVTGYLHVGHMRGFSYADAIGRYKRMTGYNVLFPVGTHATGNGSIAIANKIKKRDKDTIEYMKRNGCTDRDLEQLVDPMNVVNFFNKIYVDEYWKKFGFLADWRRFTCTLYPDYAKFVQWQFKKIYDANLLIQKPYYVPSCVLCGPVAIDASETDISKGGSAETYEYTLLKFKHGDEYLVAATLRPETVYGHVCFWVNPDLVYDKIKCNDEIWIISPQATLKLKFQKDNIEKIGEISGKDMIGWMCIAPITHKEIPVFPASFCNPDIGTGFVTSCPSDSPEDWMSLEDLKKNQEIATKYGLSKKLIDSVTPISIINIDKYGEFPAKTIIDKLGITQLNDPKLLDAKKQVYKDSHHNGIMKDVCGAFAGFNVEDAKKKIKQVMFDTGEGDVFYDLSEEVICRCGQRVYIKKIDDQWFIDYDNKSLTEKTHKHCYKMCIEPQEYHNNVHGILDWFRERACVRLGNWLGTKFPYDDKWIIEAISDSTLYPIYYLISIYVNNGMIKSKQMTEGFFDYVFLKKGDVNEVSKDTCVSVELLDRIRRDVEYWYPLDLNIGGKEHMTVHFPTFLFNHVGILPENMWPNGIMVNWYVTGKKSKISKSKGGAQPIPGAANKFSVDGMRLYYAHSASPFADIEWNENTVMSYKQKIDRIVTFVDRLILDKTRKQTSEMDEWLLSRFNTHVGVIRDAMESYNIRQLASTAYFDMFNDFRWYIRRGGDDSETIKKVLKIWITALMPITPHIAEELWAECGFEGLVSSAQFPEVNYNAHSPMTEYGEDLIKNVITDISEIIKVTGITPKRVILYTAAGWKRKVFENAVDLHKENNLDVSKLIKLCMANEEIKKNGKVVSELAKKISVNYMRLPIDRIVTVTNTDETALLSSSAWFITSEVGYPVEVYSADTADLYDPQNKARVAIPGKPGICIE